MPSIKAEGKLVGAAGSKYEGQTLHEFSDDDAIEMEWESSIGDYSDEEWGILKQKMIQELPFFQYENADFVLEGLGDEGAPLGITDEDMYSEAEKPFATKNVPGKIHIAHMERMLRLFEEEIKLQREKNIIIDREPPTPKKTAWDRVKEKAQRGLEAIRGLGVRLFGGDDAEKEEKKKARLEKQKLEMEKIRAERERVEQEREMSRRRAEVERKELALREARADLELQRVEREKLVEAEWKTLLEEKEMLKKDIEEKKKTLSEVQEKMDALKSQFDLTRTVGQSALYARDSGVYMHEENGNKKRGNSTLKTAGKILAGAKKRAAKEAQDALSSEMSAKYPQDENAGMMPGHKLEKPGVRRDDDDETGSWEPGI